MHSYRLSPIQEQTIALAGICQVAALVSAIAEKGHCDNDGFKHSIESIFTIDAADTLAVYGDLEALLLGLSTLATFGDKKTNSNAQIIMDRHMLSLIWLEKKLRKHPELLLRIQQCIQRADAQSKHFSTTHSNVIANLADAYVQSLGTFRFRIQVIGNAHYLQNRELVNKIRALLLAGIRSAVLFQQKGGSLWQLMLRKKQYKHIAAQLLKERSRICSAKAS